MESPEEVVSGDLPAAPPVAAPEAVFVPGWSWISHDGLTWWPAYRAADPSQALAGGWTNAVDWPRYDAEIAHVRPMAGPG